jgi:hypothetical protein
MRRVLFCFIGYRDPFYFKDKDVRSSAGLERHSRFMDMVASAVAAGVRLSKLPLDVNGQEMKPGPLATAMRGFRDQGWPVTDLRPIYSLQQVRQPDGKLTPVKELQERVRAVQKLAPDLMGQDPAVDPILLDCPNVADYKEAFRSVSRIATQIDEACDGTEARVLLGPGTPQLNFALLLTTLQVAPHAEIWQVKNPEDLQQRSFVPESVKSPYLKQVRFGGQVLPKILLEGLETGRERDLQREVAMLKQRLMHLESLDLESGAPVAEESPNLDLEMDDYLRRRLCAAVAAELKLAQKEGRQPVKQRLANRLGISRQNLDKKLSKFQIKFP